MQNSRLACDDGLYCTGSETCDPVLGCQDGTPPFCDDGVECTIDACDEDIDACTNTPLDFLCDDGDPCSGHETCDPIVGCVTTLDADCNGNDIEDACDIGNGSYDTNTNGIPDECEPGACCLTDGACVDVFQPECGPDWIPVLTCQPSPCVFPPVVELLGCRYLSIEASPSADPASPIALRIQRLDLPCPAKYVAPDGGIGRLVDAPLYLSADGWGTIVVSDTEMVPAATYDVRTQTVVEWSDPVVVTLRKWGDVVVPLGGTSQPNFGDISALVDCFRSVPGAPSLWACDIEPAIPDQDTDFADISAGVDAFRGLAYPFVPGGQCP